VFSFGSSSFVIARLSYSHEGEKLKRAEPIALAGLDGTFGDGTRRLTRFGQLRILLA
jgi:hypothetical protein